MLTPEHHDKADRMEEAMHTLPSCQTFRHYVEHLRKEVNAIVEPTERTLGIPAQAVYESGYVLTTEAQMDPQVVGPLIAREFRAAADRAMGTDRLYIENRLASIEKAIGA